MEIPVQSRVVDVALQSFDYPSQIRSKLDPVHCLALGENMKAVGQQVPVIGYTVGSRFRLLDGGCRLEGARLVGLSTLFALDLGREPSHAELLAAQASIDLHRRDLPPMDRARLFQSLKTENGWTARQLAECLRISEATISRTLSLLTLPEDIQDRISAGILDPAKGYEITRERDPQKQRELAEGASALTREEIKAKIRVPSSTPEPKPEAKISRTRCFLESGVQIVVSGRELSLDGIVDSLALAHREARRAKDQKLDAKTWASAMRCKFQKGDD